MTSLGPFSSSPVISIGVSSSGNGGGGILVFGKFEGNTIDSNDDMMFGFELGTIEWDGGKP